MYMRNVVMCLCMYRSICVYSLTHSIIIIINGAARAASRSLLVRRVNSI